MKKAVMVLGFQSWIMVVKGGSKASKWRVMTISFGEEWAVMGC